MMNIKHMIKIAVATALISLPFVSVNSASANEVADWQGKVGQKIAKKQIYPRSAMRKEIEGSAKIKVSIARTGEIKNFEMIEKTGHDVLDQEVPKLMDRLNPLPTPPASLTDDQLSFVMPISWRLQ
ncbi:energy transducer TonB [Paremcibacter congregatus]|uniref:TonB C-terminal domain-containing protein n=1 Tax=Paremcibacter congregatus TaxID=2043170 RepID=A0A2G4YLS5_9PROT|nr:TonB family protein [Paremcibacter congregatus]PHZ83247.1 hypothetical protein CRD36_16880 [Paremcibacter congregatus]QDE28280.1 TonB family protein [Paremcibacter congregatus]